MSNIKWNQVLDEVLSLHMEWKFNVPFSPHRTGGVEALIKLVKRGLYKAIKNETLDFLQLSVVFEEISSILNSRPLGYVVSSDKSSEKELMVTPSILCYGRNSDVLPIPVKFEDIPTLQNTSLQKIIRVPYLFIHCRNPNEFHRTKLCHQINGIRCCGYNHSV